MFGFKRKKSTDPKEATPSETSNESRQGWFGRLKAGLSKTRGQLSGLFQLGGRVDEALLEDLESHLLMADVGIETTEQILDSLRTQIKAEKITEASALLNALKDICVALLTPCEAPLCIGEARPHVILMVGINGAGKTTTIGKIAATLKDNYGLLLAAGDTFRAAAIEQLQVWGERNDVPVVAQAKGSDSAAVIYDALISAQSKGKDVLIADTAGRLHTKTQLMDELVKVKRVMGKAMNDAPHETLLVLDATLGQNALIQTKEFHQALGLTGLVVSKLDGTAKGGIVFALAHEFGLPIRYIGVGEGLADLKPFVASEFVEALFDNLDVRNDDSV